MFEQIQPWLGIGAGVVALLALLYCMVLQVKLNSLTKRHDYFMAGETGSSLERKLAVEVKEMREIAESLSGLFKEQELLKHTQQSTFQKIGFVKYNAFENIGNDLSFSLTLLDGKNNGVCISSVYGRSESRIFSKPIVNGKSLVSLSQEELESLNAALGSRSNEDVLISATVAN